MGSMRSGYCDGVKLIFLYGPAAAGKLTTARAIAARTGLPVFHNHLVVDALLEVFPFGSPEFVRLRELFWIETFRAAAASGCSLVFTFAPEGTVPTGFPSRVRAAVEESGGSVVFVHLEVSSSEQERRIENADRREFNKLASLETLRRIRSTEAPSASAGEEIAADLSLSTDDHPPAVTAQIICEALDLRRVRQARGYR